MAERAKEKGITNVVFDRGGYLYHGRIKALADAAAKQDWSSNDMPAVPVKRIDPSQLQPERTGRLDQPRDQSRQGRQEHELLGACRRGRSQRESGRLGTGKAKEVPAAIKKGIEAAKKNLKKINLLETTIKHQVLGRFGSGQVLLKPAPAGKGVIAGGPVRAVIQAVGIPNVLTKSIGSRNPHNVVKATINALEQLRDQSAVGEVRGVGQEKF